MKAWMLGLGWLAACGADVAPVREGLRTRRSLLDLVLDQSKSLDRRLGKADQAKLDEYLDNLRVAEQRIERIDRWTHVPLPEVDADALDLDVTAKQPEEYVRSLYDLMHLALRTDLTRFATFMTESEDSVSNHVGNYSNIVLGYTGNTHDIAHKRPEGISGQWELWRARQHAYFLDKLRTTAEGDGNMLDNTVVLWGSAHPLASHSGLNYPLQLAGGKHMGFKHGQLREFVGDRKVPMANLFVTMLHAMDIPTETFADSTGNLDQLLRV